MIGTSQGSDDAGCRIGIAANAGSGTDSLFQVVTIDEKNADRRRNALVDARLNVYKRVRQILGRLRVVKVGCNVIPELSESFVNGFGESEFLMYEVANLT